MESRIVGLAKIQGSGKVKQQKNGETVIQKQLVTCGQTPIAVGSTEGLMDGNCLKWKYTGTWAVLLELQ